MTPPPTRRQMFPTEPEWPACRQLGKKVERHLDGYRLRLQGQPAKGRPPTPRTQGLPDSANGGQVRSQHPESVRRAAAASPAHLAAGREYRLSIYGRICLHLSLIHISEPTRQA